MLNLPEKIFGWCYPLFRKWGFEDTIATYLSLVINLALLCFLVYLIYIGFRLLLVTLMAIVAKRTKTKFDDLLVTNKTAKYIAYLIPLLFVYKSVPLILNNFVYWESIFAKMLEVYIVLWILWIVRTVFNALRDHLKQNPKFSDKPIDSYIQIIMIVLWVFGVIIIVSEIFDIDKVISEKQKQNMAEYAK